ncbi:hypothetical protein Cgig2_023748 [Carnegiea gigantea]|uniref:Uncharacterized protein n=1 Tax=Carnegiea gigantea TaxID=171969 RepID=A0A9Q1KEP4_9CARY|nr:hypothetical protein Cgig2_023748 [Carnegiea gigantea]
MYSWWPGLRDDWDRQNPTQIVTEMCGFVTILSGTFLLHKTKDLSNAMGTTSLMPILNVWSMFFSNSEISHQEILCTLHIGVYSSRAKPELAKLRAQLAFGLELSLWLSNLSKITLELGSYKAITSEEHLWYLLAIMSLSSLPVKLSKHGGENGYDDSEGIPLRRQDAMRSP